MSRKKRRVRRRGLGGLPVSPPVYQKPYSKYTMRWLRNEFRREMEKCRVDTSALREGMEVEREHHRGVKETAKIALDHLCERGDYYQVLKRVGL